MDSIFSILSSYIEPRSLSMLTALIAGFLVGAIYLKRIASNHVVVLYHTAIIIYAYLISLFSMRVLIGGPEGIIHWLTTFVLFSIYLLGMVLGRRL